MKDVVPLSRLLKANARAMPAASPCPSGLTAARPNKTAARLTVARLEWERECLGATKVRDAGFAAGTTSDEPHATAADSKKQGTQTRQTRRMWSLRLSFSSAYGRRRWLTATPRTGWPRYRRLRSRLSSALLRSGRNVDRHRTSVQGGLDRCRRRAAPREAGASTRCLLEPCVESSERSSHRATGQ